MRLQLDSARMAVKFFVLSAVLTAFGYGVLVGRFQIFPFATLRDGLSTLTSFAEETPLAWYYRRTDRRERIDVFRRDQAYPGLNLITTIADNHHLVARIVAMDGGVVHEWDLDWFDIWEQPDHLTEAEIPNSRPGTNIHGAEVMPNGDLVFNHLHKGLVRMDICGNVIWRVGYRTHHSINVDSDGHLWVPGLLRHDKPKEQFPNHQPPFHETTLLEISPDGHILQEISVLELLQDNGLQGLLYMSSIDNLSTAVSGDTLHMNDAETFPANMKPGVFSHGDIMVSLRNVNTVLVFNEKSRKIKYIAVGRFVRQHDPDFIDGDRISVFDNNNIAPASQNPQSRILIMSARDNAPRIYFQGDDRHRFYTDIMGKHQWLPNGNLLVTEARAGRAFELAPGGEVVWQYHNLIGGGRVSWMEEVQRLSLDYQQILDRALASNCRSRERPTPYRVDIRLPRPDWAGRFQERSSSPATRP